MGTNTAARQTAADDVEEVVQGVFRRVLDRDDFVLERHLTGFDVEGWDSMANIQILLGIEAALGVRFTASEVRKLANAGELVDAVRQKLKSK